MKKRISEFEKFEIGSISLFTGLAFLTLIPVIMRNLLISLEPNVYRLFGGFFLLIATLFYFYSHSYITKKISYLGTAFIIFSIFQTIFGVHNSWLFLFSNIFSFILGLLLCFIGIYLKKRNFD